MIPFPGDLRFFARDIPAARRLPRVPHIRIFLFVFITFYAPELVYCLIYGLTRIFCTKLRMLFLGELISYNSTTER